MAPVRPPACTGLLERSAFLPLSQTDSIINDEAAPVRPPAFTGLLDRSTFIPSGQSDSIISESTPIDLQAPSPARSDGAVPLQQPLTQFENDQPSPDSPPVPEVRVPIGPASMVTSSSASIHSYGGRSHDVERFYPDQHRSRHSNRMDPAYNYYSPQEQRLSSFERLSRHSLSSYHHPPRVSTSPYPQATLSMPTRAMTGETPSQYMRNRHDRRDATTHSFHERYGQRGDVRGSTRHLSINSSHAYLPYPTQAPPSRHYQSPSHYDRYDPHYRRQSHTSREGFTRTAPHVRHSDSDDNNYYGQGRF